MFIVFEGIDRSGKSSLSVEFCKALNQEENYGLWGKFTRDSLYGPWEWTKEPTFTTEEADRLNSLVKPEDQFARECAFLESRIAHQPGLVGRNIVCDRYIWTGMTYCKVFSPQCFDFAAEIYSSKKLFKQPDLYVYVDASVDACCARDKSLNPEILQNLKQAFVDTADKIGCPIIKINNDSNSLVPEDGIKRTLEDLLSIYFSNGRHK